MNRRQYKQVVKIIGKECSDKKIVYKLYKVGKYTTHGTAYYVGRYDSREEAINFAKDFKINYFVIEKVVSDSQGNEESTTLV